MRARPPTRFALLALPLLLAGCGTKASATHTSEAVAATTTATTTTTGTGATPSSAGPQLADGMSMAPGGTMADRVASQPPPTASMVCGEEIQGSIETLLALPGRPAGTSTWGDGLFTCTYTLPQGRLVLSVQQSADPAAAMTYFATLRNRTRNAAALTGLTALGLPAFQSDSGIVSFVKDNLTLKVDATALTATVGPQRTSRGEFAYTVATDVLACWQE
ncbi:hypothetical protein V3N99_09135 [Dermatophilaceae bacterium Soc4.6]